MKMVALFGVALLLAGCGSPEPVPPPALSPSAPSGTQQTGQVGAFAADSLVSEVAAHPAFAGFGEYLFPVKNRGGVPEGMTLDGIGALLPYHNAIRTDTTVEVLNYLLGQAYGGQQVFYDIYSDAEQRADPGLGGAGLFFFRGDPGAPFAVVCAGGGFSYVGSIHESFPQALELSKRGYNAFAVEYRLGSGEAATEDLAAAISFIFANADQLRVSTEGYSVWGGSAGARMAASVASHGTAAYGGDDLPRPATAVIGYTGHTDYAADDTASFIYVSQDDPIASPAVMRQRADNLQAVGVDVEFALFERAGHGFGLGIGTDAEGWLDRAVAFWEKHIS
jgi:acetyl esterase/lipase